MFVIKLHQDGSPGMIPRVLFSGTERDCKIYVQEVRNIGGMTYTFDGDERVEIVSPDFYFLRYCPQVGGR